MQYGVIVAVLACIGAVVVGAEQPGDAVHVGGPETRPVGAARGVGWAGPLDQQPVRDDFGNLGAEPHDRLDDVSWTVMLRHYAPWAIAAVSIVAALLAYVAARLRRVTISQRRTAELLRESKEQYRILADYSTGTVYWRRPDGTFAYVSPAAAELTGYSADELQARPQLLDEMVYPDDRAAWEVHHQLADRDGGSEPVEFRIVTKSGEVRWISHICRAIHDSKGRLLGRRGRHIDITELKQAESEAMREAACTEAINRLLAEALIGETEEDLGRTCLATAGELTNSHFGMFGFLNAQGLFDVVAISDSGWDACALPREEAGVAIRDMPIRGIDRATLRDGRSRIVNDMATHPDRVGVPEGHAPLTCFLGVPLKEQGKVIGMIGLANKSGGYDVADQRAVEKLAASVVAAFRRKRAEEEARTRAAQLEMANVELAAAKEAVEGMVADLQRSNRELDDFAYIASHDLKEPLRGIHNYASFVLEDYADKLDDEGRAKLEVLPRLCQRLESFIDSLLQYSRLGRTELDVEDTDLNEVLAEVTDSLRGVQEERGVDIRVRGPLPTVKCNRVRVGEVFRNLTSNAMKYNDKEEKWIEIGCTNAGEGESDSYQSPPVFYVRDNGIGIREKHQDVIFRIFKRLHGRDKYGGGTGAGLTIVKKIVERHGGRIWVESNPGEGTTFYFTLQEARADDRSSAEEFAASSAGGG